MPAEVYEKSQIDTLFGVVGARINTETEPSTLKSKIDALTDTGFITDAERTKLAGLEGSKYLGTFTSVASIPTVSAVAGSYADVDTGAGVDIERYIWDATDSQFVKAVGTVAAETAASVKVKYEDNADTNAFTDAEKAKLGALSIAANTTSAVAALDGAIS